MKCKKCGSENVTIQAVAEVKKRSLISLLLWALLALCTCGIILVIPLWRGKKTNTIKYAICQDCGYKKKV